jgi:hypothetical protein
MLKITPISIANDNLVVAKIQTPPSNEMAAHTAKIIKKM